MSRNPNTREGRVQRFRKPRRLPPVLQVIWRILRPLLIIFLAFCVFFGAVVGGLYAVNRVTAPTPLAEIPENQRSDVARERAESNVTFLLVGSDERGDETARSDTMIYTVVRPVDRKIAYLSLPRDTLVEIPGVGQDKLNHAYAYGGMNLLLQTLQKNFSTQVDYTVRVNFETFKDVIDAMGGINMDVEQDMYLPEEGIDLKAGEQHLNGYDALAYVRWRGDGLGDLGRIQRQQKFMQAVTQKAQRMMPWQAVRVALVLKREVKTDVSFTKLLTLASKFVGAGKDDVMHYSLEVTPVDYNGISYVTTNSENVRQVFQEMYYGMVLY